MSINNVSGVTDALNYINGVSISKKEDGVIKDTVGRIASPSAFIFGLPSAIDGLKKNFQAQNTSEVLSLFKNKGALNLSQTTGDIVNFSANYSNLVKVNDNKFTYDIVNDGLNVLKKNGKIKSSYKGTVVEKTLEDGSKAFEIARTETGKIRVKGSIKNFFKSAVEDKVKAAEKKATEKLAEKTAESTVEKAAGTAAENVAENVAEKASGGFLSGIKSKIGGVLSKIPGVSKVGKLFKGIGNTTFGKCLKGTGAVGMMIFEGVFEFATEVIPAFKNGGFMSGMRQMGKSAAKVVSSGLGWAGGQIAGQAIGSMIGGAIGSVFPVIGNAVGASIGGAIGGFIGGTAGSALASGVAKKIVGKSEKEKYQEQQAKEQAMQIAMDPNSMNELNAAVYQKVQQDIQNGTVTEDTEKMAEYLNQNGYSPYASNDYSQMQYNDQTQNTTGQNYWSVMAQRAMQGDTSIYNVSNDRLNSVFTHQNNNQVAFTSNGNYATSGYNFPNSQAQNGQYNYFAMG